ncbi:hypothetical protein FO488_05885 [Geobacter sp. FeAm09]|uniref:hypothetical protein n=1 Tax=Geobacter sp. FeAm09 TaxID=2597769 RepID=UPI0011F0429D|nr:hypothetical protein [Geobacter sp. FeAm09]QEM67730.1 hypothetical protein FO488_05885 [Geobacter sp. FeAm09]
MKEGWIGDDYLILFDDSEQAEITEGYKLETYLLGYRIKAILGWDDFIITNPAGDQWRVPAVPLAQKYLEKSEKTFQSDQLETDSSHAGKIKWYVQPIVFGGDPAAEENMIWIDLKSHQELVVWWNEKYRQLTGE